MPEFSPIRDPRVRGTIAAIVKDLMSDGLVARYPTKPDVDGLPSGEGVFLPCTFWLLNNLSLLGQTDNVRHIFERLLTLRNDVGLLSEEYNPATRRLVGNFPQAFTRVGLVNSARKLSEHNGPAHDRHQQ